MVRSLIIIALAIVCGAAAAIGVLRSRPTSESVKPETRIVYLASRRIARGERIRPDMIRRVEWPVIQDEDMISDAEELPPDPISKAEDALDRVAMSTIMRGEPLFDAKLSNEKDQAFIASVVEHGMRVKSIETRGPAASVAGFVRPQDHVDVLLNIRGGAGDRTGGSSTTTLLQNVEVLAIDQVVDPEVDAMQMLEKWAKGDEPTSVTLAVTPLQAELLDLGEKFGELSLTLRPLGDVEELETLPATINDVHSLGRFVSIATQASESTPDDNGEQDTTPAVGIGERERDESPRPITIWGMRGSTTSLIQLQRRQN